MKILDFRWSKKAKLTLETITFWQNISTSFFKFSPFLYTLNACRRNLFSIFQIYKRFAKEREKRFIQQSMRKQKLRKVGRCFVTGYFILSPFDNYSFFLFRKLISQCNFRFLLLGWRKNYQKGKLGTASS